jgi:hypothetical protein
MDIIEIKTLIDVTNTRVNRPNQGSQIAYDQNRNFITLSQCIEIRSIVSYEFPPIVEEVELKGLGFGTEFKGCHKVWTFTFSPDREGVYEDSEGNIVGSLIEDLDGVPIIKNLTETINMGKAIFNCKDLVSRNTIITAHTGTH